MRRILGPILFIALFALTIPVAAHESGDYKDKFTSISWGGSDGSLYWSGPWQEIGDDGDEKQGNVRVVSPNCDSGNCMRFSALTTLLGPIGASRNADTSVFEEAELRFKLKATAALISSQLLVQVNDGGGWTTVATYNLGAAQTDHPTIDISAYRSDDFRLRFRFTGLLLSSEVYIDNVEITGDLIETPTTTTTTAPTTTSTTQDDDGPSSTTTTTRSEVSTTTTIRATTTTRPTTTSNPDDDTSTTTTLVGTTTTTTTVDDGGDSTMVATGGGGGSGSDDGDVPPGSEGGPEGSGIRQTARGLQANFDGGLFGEVSPIAPITGVDFQARFSMAVEMIEASWVWIVLLSLVIAWSIVTGMDRRRSQQLG